MFPADFDIFSPVELEQPVVGPDVGEAVPERPRLGELVLVVGEDEVEPAAVDLERRARAVSSAITEHSMCQPGRPSPQGEGQRGVLAGLRRLPEREVARVLLARVRLAVLDLVGALPREPAVVGEARDPEVDVAVDRVGEAALDELLDERDDLRDVLGHLRQVVGQPEPEIADVLEVPGGRALGELGARARAPPRRSCR